MMKKYLLTYVVTLLSVMGTATAQPVDRNHLSVGVGGRYCNILNSHHIYEDLLGTHSYGIYEANVSYVTRPEDGSWFDRAFNYPTFGVSLSYENAGSLSFKNNSRLGDFVNLYGWAEFNLVRTKKFRAGPLLELGFAFTGETYDYYANPKNTYIGSKVLAVLGFGLQAEWLFHPRWSLNAGAYLLHHSNGMTRSPNNGINEFAAGIGVRHYLSPRENSPRPDSIPEKPKYKKGLNWNVFAAGGVHSCAVELDGIEKNTPGALAPARFYGLIGFEALWRYSPIFASGLGFEGSYAFNNYRQTDLRLRAEVDPDGYSPFRIGAFVKQEFWFRRISVNVAVGLYLYKRCGLTEDVSSMFEKVGIRYHFRYKSGLYLGMDLRAHQFDRSYSLDWSVGYRL